MSDDGKALTKSALALSMREAGIAPDKIAEELGTTRERVYGLVFFARHRERRIADCRARMALARRAAGCLTSEQLKAKRSADAEERDAPIVSAVEAGMTYAEAAIRFGKSREAVAGIIHRHRKRRAKLRTAQRVVPCVSADHLEVA